MFFKNPGKPREWLDAMAKMDIPEITSFAEGIRKDTISVQNRIAYDYNDGSAEGDIKKIKVIKRILYGQELPLCYQKPKHFYGKHFTIKSTKSGKNLFTVYRKPRGYV